MVFCCVCGTRCSPDLLRSVRLQLEVNISTVLSWALSDKG